MDPRFRGDDDFMFSTLIRIRRGNILTLLLPASGHFFAADQHDIRRALREQPDADDARDLVQVCF